MIFSIACAKIAENVAVFHYNWQIRQSDSIDKLDKVFLCENGDGVVESWTDKFISIVYIFIEIASNSHVITIIVRSDLFEPLERMLVFDVVMQ